MSRDTGLLVSYHIETMPNKATLIAMGLGLAAAALIVGAIVFMQRGATPRLVGEITRVRTLETDPSGSVAIVDFRFTNDSHYAFLVKSAELSIIDFKGQARQGQTASAADAVQLFTYFPALGSQTAEPLVARTRIGSGASREGMLVARFELPKAELDARRKMVLAVTEVDGAVSEISQ
jgi:hypothetical protein